MAREVPGEAPGAPELPLLAVGARVRCQAGGVISCSFAGPAHRRLTV